MTPAPIHPARLCAADRKQQLLETAFDFFSRKGFDGTTTKEIAAAAAVTEAVIFRHFPTKQALYTAVLDYRLQFNDTHGWLPAAKEAMERNDDEGLLRMIATHIVRSYRTDPRFERMMLFAALEGHALALDYIREQTFPVFQLLRDYILRRQAEGALRHVPLGVVFTAIFGMAHHYCQITQMFGYPALNTSDEAMVDGFVRVVLDGLRPVPSEKHA
ncbi:MAG: hypothetical protein C5B51_22370 [Terriglobia bacterium]|nr:MAG: hypothetical protein C5B51_22370 [Terriglobia bacterium]